MDRRECRSHSKIELHDGLPSITLTMVDVGIILELRLQT